MSGIEFHPLADIFPLIEGSEFDELVADIKAHGVHEPIWLYQGKIIDGRNRYRASAVASADCPMREYMGDDPTAFVVSLNLKRRHLNESQRSMVADKLATLKQGARTDLSPIGEMSQEQAASLLNVGKRSVERARVVRDQGADELVAAVEQGKVSVSAAADVATKPKEEQREIVARGEKEVLEAAKAIRAVKVEKKRGPPTSPDHAPTGSNADPAETENLARGLIIALSGMAPIVEQILEITPPEFWKHLGSKAVREELVLAVEEHADNLSYIVRAYEALRRRGRLNADDFADDNADDDPVFSLDDVGPSAASADTKAPPTSATAEMPDLPDFLDRQHDAQTRLK
jgi:ParB-like chromosome segregation protein Spo0J